MKPKKVQVAFLFLENEFNLQEIGGKKTTTGLKKSLHVLREILTDVAGITPT